MRRALVLLAALAGTWLLPSSPADAGCGLVTKHGRVAAYRSSGMTTERVVLYGDSITYQVVERLRIRHGELGVDAYWGRRTRGGVDAFARDLYFAKRPPQAVVMALGTNDTRQPQEMASLVRYTRSVLPRTTRLLWLNTYVESRPGWEQVNREIALVPGVEVIDWAARNLRARGRAERSPLLYDGVHLSCAGADAWIRLVEASLRHPVTGALAPLSDQAAETGYP